METSKIIFLNENILIRNRIRGANILAESLYNDYLLYKKEPLNLKTQLLANKSFKETKYQTSLELIDFSKYQFENIKNEKLISFYRIPKILDILPISKLKNNCLIFSKSERELQEKHSDFFIPSIKYKFKILNGTNIFSNGFKYAKENNMYYFPNFTTFRLSKNKRKKLYKYESHRFLNDFTKIGMYLRPEYLETDINQFLEAYNLITLNVDMISQINILSDITSFYKLREKFQEKYPNKNLNSFIFFQNNSEEEYFDWMQETNALIVGIDKDDAFSNTALEYYFYKNSNIVTTLSENNKNNSGGLNDLINIIDFINKNIEQGQLLNGYGFKKILQNIQSIHLDLWLNNKYYLCNELFDKSNTLKEYLQLFINKFYSKFKRKFNEK